MAYSIPVRISFRSRKHNYRSKQNGRNENNLVSVRQNIPVVVPTHGNITPHRVPINDQLSESVSSPVYTQIQRPPSMANTLDQPALVATTMTMALVNCRSLNRNGFKLKDYVVGNDCDLVGITETWLPHEECLSNQIINDSCPKEYKMAQKPRNSGQRGGGVGILYKKTLALRAIENDNTFNSFEYTEHLLKSDSIWIRVIVVYRPPPSGVNGSSVSQFLCEFSTFLEHLVLLPGEILVMGDFNFHVNDPTNHSAREFAFLLDTYNMSQHVTDPTHQSGHTLDLLITREGSDLISDVQVHVPWISDHGVVQFKITTSKPRFPRKTIVFRRWKSLDINQFQQDVAKINFPTNYSVSDLTIFYNNKLHDLLEKHVPLKSKTITLRAQAEWFNNELLQVKRKKRKLERKYRLTNTSEDARRFKEHSEYYSQLLATTRHDYYTNKIESNSRDQKALFHVLNKLLHRNVDQQFPPHDNLEELTNRFSNFFIRKIEKIRSQLHATANGLSQDVDTCCMSARMTDFTSISEQDTEIIIRKTNNKSCRLDPLPTWLLKQCISTLLPIITGIINLSLNESIMPTTFKEALLAPILKHASLSTDEEINFRPISNLPYVSKLIEKAVDIQLTDHIKECDHDEAMQSAYKKHHSTETAWVRLHNDILCSLDENMAVLLVCLDLSAAFDTIDHGILLHRLKNRLGISGNCLKWFQSYLSDRKVRVTIDGKYSKPKDLNFGVPQGSVLGPKLFTLYMLPLGDIARKHSIDFHIYADDCQLYLSFKQENRLESVHKMECLVSDIKSWMSNNMLKLNDDKSEFLVLTGPRRVCQLDPPSLVIGSDEVIKSESVRLLGVELDGNITLKKHVRSVAKSLFFKLQNMYKIRKCITEDGAKIMVHSMITSKLDYCNAILYGLPDCDLNRLYSVQKLAARLITGTKKYDHISPVLEKLHWLPIKMRIEYKILLLVFKCLHGSAPVYLSELLEKRINKGTRADNKNLLVVPRFKNVTLGGRSFSRSSPILWNNLPDSLRLENNFDIFKNHLKTYFFKLSYN